MTLFDEDENLRLALAHLIQIILPVLIGKLDRIG